MAINPATEVYLLDPEGAVLGHAAPAGIAVRDRVAIGPLRTFLDRPRNCRSMATIRATPTSGRCFRQHRCATTNASSAILDESSAVRPTARW